MLLDKVLHQVVAMAQPIVKKLETQVKAWTKPATDSLIGGTAADLMKSKEQLIMENALLRQQVIVLKRQVARPQLTAQDRSVLGRVAGGHCCPPARSIRKLIAGRNAREDGNWRTGQALSVR
jgi:hypothetical protein